jgi:hypothetical protein
MPRKRCLPRKELARDGWECVIDVSFPGWQHTGKSVATPDGGENGWWSLTGWAATSRIPARRMTDGQEGTR